MERPPGEGRNPYKFPIGDDRNQIQRSLLRNLRKVPGVENVRYEESGTGVEYQVVGEIDTAIYADGLITCETASVTANWWPLDDDTDEHWYKFHYFESSGFDCGWHRQTNDHVSGLDHYQERESPEDEYEYYEFHPAHRNPVGLLWEIVGDRLEDRLIMRHE